MIFVIYIEVDSSLTHMYQITYFIVKYELMGFLSKLSNSNCLWLLEFINCQ